MNRPYKLILLPVILRFLFIMIAHGCPVCYDRVSCRGTTSVKGRVCLLASPPFGLLAFLLYVHTYRFYTFILLSFVCHITQSKNSGSLCAHLLVCKGTIGVTLTRKVK